MFFQAMIVHKEYLRDKIDAVKPIQRGATSNTDES